MSKFSLLFRDGKSARRTLHRVFAVLLSLSLLMPGALQAHIVTDGTMGPAMSLPGPEVVIPQDLGTTRGQNLFHSFQKFGIPMGESATFTGADSIANVISRVTGGEASHIDGLLRSQVGTADFFFINPSGMVFGPAAQVNVPAAFHVSTAHELKFADGASFNAINPAASTLTQAAPEAFGFLGAQSSDIKVTGARLEFKPETKVSLVSSGNIEITENALLGAFRGDFNFLAQADLVADTAIVQASSMLQGSGAVTIRAANAYLDNCKIFAQNFYGQSDADVGVDIHVTDRLEIINGSIISTETHGGGRAGDVIIHAGQMKIGGYGAQDESSSIQTKTFFSPKNSGNITITVEGLLEVLDGGLISSGTIGTRSFDSPLESDGHAGNITIRSGQMRMDGQDGLTRVETETLFSSGNAGNIDINVEKGHLEVLHGAEISSSARQLSTGKGGAVDIKAGQMTIEGIVGNFADESSEGNAGSITINVTDTLKIRNDGSVFAPTSGYGNAGSVSIHAGRMAMDGQGNITTLATATSSGKGGNIDITVGDLLELLNGSAIFSNSASGKDAGNVTIKAARMIMDGQGNDLAAIGAITLSDGKAGSIDITVSGLLKLLNGAAISSNTSAAGDAGSVSITAGRMIIDGQGSDQRTVIASAQSSESIDSTGHAGNVTINVQDSLQILNGGRISTDTYATGNAGTVTVKAGRMTIDGQGNNRTMVTSRAQPQETFELSKGNAGNVNITVDGRLDVLHGGQISSSTFAKGHAGNVTIKAEFMIIDGETGTLDTGIASTAGLQSEGNAGTVDISVDNALEMLRGAQISSSTYSLGDAGNVKIHAGSLKMDRQNSTVHTEIAGKAAPSSQGKGGKVDLSVAGLVEILNGAIISTSTFSTKDAGDITIAADQLAIDRQGTIYGTGIASTAGENSRGNAGTVLISVRDLIKILDGGQISSSTFSVGNAGSVTIKAGEMIIDRQGREYSTGIASEAALGGDGGNAGKVQVSVRGLLQLLAGGQISSSTWTEGNAGDVIVTAGDMIVDGRGSSHLTGITSEANARDAWGNAGKIDISVENVIKAVDQAEISTATFSKGNAGNVIVEASEIILDAAGITSDATSTSTGQVGNVTVNAGSIHLRNNSTISIEAHQTLPPERLNEPKRTLTVNAWNANTLSLDGGSKISTESTGNSPAGDIVVRSPRIDIRGDSSVSTLAQNADGGAVTLQARTIFLDDGLITTSVEGLTGDGGDILISGMQDGEPADFLIMRHGFIQANTAAPGAAGGDIGLRVRRIIDDRSGGALVVDALERMDYHADAPRSVIQAAAPGGTKGEINVSDASLLDISGSIIPMRSQPAQPIALSTDPCDIDPAREKASSLVLEGSAAIPEGTKFPLAIPMDGTRLDGLMEPTL